MKPYLFATLFGIVLASFGCGDAPSTAPTVPLGKGGFEPGGMGGKAGQTPPAPPPPPPLKKG